VSIKVMTWVWDHSRARGSQHHVLLAIADCASDDGSNAYPSITELMRKTRLSERAVQYALKGLMTLGELFVSSNGGPRGCNRYRVVMASTPQIQHPAEFAPPPQILRHAKSDLSQEWVVSHPAHLAPRTSSTPQDVRRDDADLAPGTVLDPSEKKISSSKRSSEPRGSRLPEPYDITEAMRDWVRTECPDVRLPEHDRFCDYWRGQPGAKGRKADWFATWRNWMRRAQDDIAARKDRTSGHKPSTTDARVAEGLALAERLERMELPA